MNINKLLVMLILALVFGAPVLAAKAPDVGTLQVFSEREEVYIFIDGFLKGKNAVIKKDVQVGEHYIKARQDSKNGPLVFSSIVVIKEGEVKTVLIPAGGENLPVTATTTTTISTAQATALLSAETGAKEEKVKLHPSDTVYHRIEAVDITGEGLVIVERSTAEKKGYRPCKNCFPDVQEALGTQSVTKEASLPVTITKEAGTPQATVEASPPKEEQPEVKKGLFR